MKKYKQSRKIRGSILTMYTGKKGRMALIHVAEFVDTGAVMTRRLIFKGDEASRVIEEATDTQGGIKELYIELEAETTTLVDEFDEFVYVDGISSLEITWEGNDDALKALEILINQD